MARDPAQGGLHASFVKGLREGRALGEGVGGRLPTEVGNHAEVGLGVGEDGELRGLRVGGQEAVQREGEGGFDGEGLAGGGERVRVVRGGGERVGVFLPGPIRCYFLFFIFWFVYSGCGVTGEGEQEEEMGGGDIPRQGLSVGVVLAVDNAYAGGFAGGLVGGPAPVGP